jgi:hypothetical protein
MDTLDLYHQQRAEDGRACLAAALDYLRRGWPVLALCPPDHVGVGRGHGRVCKDTSWGKAPLICWKAYQTGLPTAEEVLGWWRYWPTANLGMALGGPSRLARLDVDGPLGETELTRLSGGDLPPTLEFHSGRTNGGRGLLFRIPEGQAWRTKKEGSAIGEELRIQALGAQTVLPPARHRAGALYVWLPGRSPAEREPAPAPGWLVQRMTAPAARRPRPARTSPGRTANPAEAPDPKAVALALEALRHLSPSRAAGYDEWLHVGMALHAVDPSEAMLTAWDTWSEQCPQEYEEGVCAAKWATFHADGGLQLCDLLSWARQDTNWSPDGESRQRIRRGTGRRHRQNVLRFCFAVGGTA